MENTNHINGDAEQMEDINAVVSKVSDFYLKEINMSITEFNQQKHQRSKQVLSTSKIHFQRIKKLLTYVTGSAQDAQNIEDASTQLKNIETVLTDLGQRAEFLPLELERRHRMPDLRPEIASNVLNTGTYNLFKPHIGYLRNFTSKLEDVYDYQKKILQRKMIFLEVPKENISLSIEEGVLKVETNTLSFELMVFWDNVRNIHPFFLTGFEHKLMKKLSPEKYTETLFKIRSEIEFLYGKRGNNELPPGNDEVKENEVYILVFILYRIKALYSRQKLQIMMKQAQILKEKISTLNNQETFDLNEIDKPERLYYEITYWDKTSLLQQLKPENILAIFFEMEVKTMNFNTFLESYKKDPYSTMSGIGEDDIVKITHKPPIISQEAIINLYNCLRETQHQGVVFKKFQEILSFGTSNKLRLGGFSINNSFIELFTEIKRMFSIQQIIYYYSFLYQKLNPMDLENIKLIYRNEGELHNNQSLIKQRDIKIAIQVENHTFILFIDQKTGMLDLSTENAPKLIEINKYKFKKILTDVSADFGQIMILYKKLLFLSSCNKLLDTHYMRFHVPKYHKSKDYLKSIEMRSSIIQFVKAPESTSSRHLMEVTLNYELIFDPNLEKFDVEACTKFALSAINKSDEVRSKFIPFDLKKILKQLDEEIKKSRASAYFDHELRFSYKIEELKENDNPLPKLSSSWKQKRDILDNHTLITLIPSDPLLTDLRKYLNDKQGVKLVYTQANVKTLEKIEKNKLTIKYDSTIEGYKAMVKDVEKLESFLRQHVFAKPQDFYKAQEYHSTSFHYLLEAQNEKVMFRYVGNKLTEIIPSKFQNLRLFLDDRDTISNKENFTRMMIQAYPVLINSLLFTESKDLWFYPEKTQSVRQDMFIHIMMIDPFRFMYIFRNIYKPNGNSVFLFFQICGDECELINAYKEEYFKYMLIPYNNFEAILNELPFPKKFPMAKLKEFGAKVSSRIKSGPRQPTQIAGQPRNPNS